ncbi:MAG: NusG domain II-containing protein [Ruminococcus sp.]|jgi:hypothetical protein|nr:NusG domain II-containing protein [Ruminococcus sp.]
MKYISKGEIIAIVALLLVSIILIITMSIEKSGSVAVVNYKQEVYYIDLNTNSNFNLTDLVKDETPHMTFEVSDGGVRVTYSDCPGHDCIRQGFIHRGNEIIACVPNGVSVVILPQNEKALDAYV